MNRWLGKVAVVTGASSGIGSAVAIDLANAGMIVVGLARRQHRIDELKSKLAQKCPGELHSFKCDVSAEKDVMAAFAWITSKFGGVDVLINNAGCLRPGKILDANNSKAMREVIDTNLTGTVYCVREAFASMKARKVIDGHIVLINSITGHDVPHVPGVSFNIYPCTKYAITAMTEVLRQELLAEGTTIKVTSVSPGWVKTEIVPDSLFQSNPGIGLLEPEDISESILYVLGTPRRVQVHELIIKPIGQKF